MKLSKSKRKKLKVEAARTVDTASKMGKPYSKHKIRTCLHYGTGLKLGAPVENKIVCDSMIIYTHHHLMRAYYSLITEDNEQYICTRCKHKFTRQQYELMQCYIESKNISPENNIDLPIGIEPVTYYHAEQDRIVEV